MSSSLLSKLREFFFPADKLPAADFPWKRGVLSTFGIIAVALILIFFAPLVVLIPLKGLRAIFPDFSTALTHNKLLYLALMEALTYVTGFGAAVWYLRKRFGRDTSLSKLVALKPVPSIWKTIFTAAGFLIAADILSQLMYVGFHLPTPDSPAGDFGSQLRGMSFLIFGLITVVGAPIFEELVFRGFVFNMLRHSFGTTWRSDLAAAVVSGAIFAAGHMTLTGFPELFIVGVGLALMYRHTGSLYGSMTMHALNNLMATIALYVSIHAPGSGLLWWLSNLR